MGLGGTRAGTGRGGTGDDGCGHVLEVRRARFPRSGAGVKPGFRGPHSRRYRTVRPTSPGVARETRRHPALVVVPAGHDGRVQGELPDDAPSGDPDPSGPSDGAPADDGPAACGATAVLPAGSPSTGRTPLDRRRVLDAAIEYIDRHGLAALTMRRLGAALGVEAMALYRYVPGREQLLDGVVETVIDELYGDPEVHMQAAHGWQDFLQRLAHGVRRIALAHPEVFPLVATRPPAAPWVRPPLRSLRWVESFLTAMTDSGFSDEAAVGAYRAYSSFLLGHLLLEVSQKGVAISAEDVPGDGAPSPGADLRSYPSVVRLESLLSRDETAAEFEEALENLLGRLETVRQEGRAPGE